MSRKRTIGISSVRRLMFLNALVLGLLLVTGCSDDSSEPQDEQTTTSTVTTQSGGDLRIVWGVDVDFFDPAAQAQGTARELSRIALQGLTELTNEGDVVPALAESWTVSDDGLLWTFDLQEGVVFQDGTPFNADTVVANMNRWLDPDFLHTTRSRIEAVTEVRAVDDQTVEFALSAPYPLLAHTMGEGFHLMLSQQDIEDHYLELGSNLPVGTGPYQLVELVPLERMVFERWDGYQGPGEPSVDRIIFETVPNDASRTAQILAGEADLNIYQALQDVERLEGTEGVQIFTTPALRGWQVYLNVNQEKLADIRIRQALNHAIDQNAIIQNVFRGLATENRGAMSLGHTGWTEASPYYEYDPDRAVALFAEAGWNQDADGRLVNDSGEPFTLRLDMSTGGVYVGDDGMAEVISGFWNEIGVNVERVSSESSTFFDTILGEAAPGTLEATGIPLFISFQDGPAWMALTYGETARPPGNCCNISFLTTEALQSLIDSALAESDPATRADLNEQALQEAWGQVPSVLGPQLQWVVSASPRVSGLELAPSEAHNIAFVRLEGE